MMLHWISEYCTSSPHSDLRKYVLFVDDDYYIDINSFITYINKVDGDRDMTTYERRTFLTGYVYKESCLRRFFRNGNYFLLHKKKFSLKIIPICIHGYRGEELINIWNNIYQTNLTLRVTI
jgi:hypothetical protein